MSIPVAVTATIDNQTPYTLSYSSQNLSYGKVTIDAKTIDASTSALAFVGASFPGPPFTCEGTVTYSFTDQNGATQYVSFFYEDPYEGPNEFSVAAPPGISSKNNGPPNGTNVKVTYAINGRVEASS